SVFGYVDPVRNSRTSKYAPLLCSVSPSQNSAFEGFERGPVYFMNFSCFSFSKQNTCGLFWKLVKFATGANKN
ncbi:MAG: hypothetical protein LBF72_02305, partial [Holosporales bacterium]|nr:hypothetical protein [Holosporales bacterium]